MVFNYDTVAGASAEARAETAAPTGGKQIEVADRRAGKQRKRSREGAKGQEESLKKQQKERSKAKKKRKAAEKRDVATAGCERPA